MWCELHVQVSVHFLALGYQFARNELPHWLWSKQVKSSPTISQKPIFRMTNNKWTTSQLNTINLGLTAFDIAYLSFTTWCAQSQHPTFNVPSAVFPGVPSSLDSELSLCSEIAAHWLWNEQIKSSPTISQKPISFPFVHMGRIEDLVQPNHMSHRVTNAVDLL